MSTYGKQIKIYLVYKSYMPNKGAGEEKYLLRGRSDPMHLRRPTRCGCSPFFLIVLTSFDANEVVGSINVAVKIERRAR